MFMLRNGPKGAGLAPFGFVFCLALVTPTTLGYQDIAALLTHQAGVAERWQRHILASSRASLQVASFHFPRPVGTDVPKALSLRLASLSSQEVAGSLGRNPFGRMLRPLQASDYPMVMRAAKADRLPVVAPAVETPAPPPAQPDDPTAGRPMVQGIKTVEAAPDADEAPLDDELQEALNAPHLPQFDAARETEEAGLNGEALDDDALAALHVAPGVGIAAMSQDPFSIKTSSLFFSGTAFGASGETLQHWEPGQEPVIVGPGDDPDLKQSASLPSKADAASAGGETIAGKGQITSEVALPRRRPASPAERLNLEGKSRAKAEKCLTDAIYFEARGEKVRGQIAVAQVVVNRVFSGYYPTTVCGVIYQNANRHLACQFTFACDGIRDVVKEPDMWVRAKKIAKATLDGRLWLPEVGKSTHYHAYWVRPSWVREMRKMYKLGVHTFYRPRAWGDGKDAPSWGTTAQTAQISAELAAVKP